MFFRGLKGIMLILFFSRSYGMQQEATVPVVSLHTVAASLVDESFIAKSYKGFRATTCHKLRKSHVDKALWLDNHEFLLVQKAFALRAAYNKRTAVLCNDSLNQDALLVDAFRVLTGIIRPHWHRYAKQESGAVSLPHQLFCLIRYSFRPLYFYKIDCINDFLLSMETTVASVNTTLKMQQQLKNCQEDEGLL
jgi:hypothetical protein